jgi:tetratricopeptide (TPR) repeat protein
MILRHYALLLIAALALALCVPVSFSLAQAEEEEEESSGEEEEEEEEAGPAISREDEDDVDSWSFEGEVEKKEEVKKEVKKKALPPEPKRYGNSGNWYDVGVECGGCATLLGQQLGIEDSLVMREFFDYVQIASDRKSGRFVYPSEGESRSVGVRDGGSRVLLWVYASEKGTRLTDTFATVWDLQRKADSGLLYGRKYEVQAWTADAYTQSDDGFKANQRFISSSKLLGYADLAPVKGLTVEEPRFQVGENIRVSLLGYSAFVRSDIKVASIEKEQEGLKAAAEAEAKRLRDQTEWFVKGEGHLDSRSWEDALVAFKKAREFGLESLDLSFYLGFAFQRTGDFENAIKEYRAVLAADPRDTDVRYNLARIYEKKKSWDEAIKEYQAILKFSPDDQGARERLELLRAARAMIDG